MEGRFRGCVRGFEEEGEWAVEWVRENFESVGSVGSENLGTE